jgi:hypothetical protein
LLSSPPEIFEKFASFVRSVTPKDSKDNIIVNVKDKDKDKDKEFGTVYLGLELKIPGASPEIAQLRSQLFAEYFVDSILYVDLTTWMDSAVLSRETDSYNNKFETIKITRDIDETERRLAGLRTLVKRYPDAARMDIRQVLSIDKGSERFLSPVAQIIAAESSIVDGKIKLASLLRKQKQIDMAYAFYQQVIGAKATTNSGRELLKRVLVLKDGSVKNMAASDEVETEVVNEISHEVESRRVNYATNFKFISGPTLPEAKIKKSALLVALAAGAGGMFSMVILAFLISWWRKNRRFITEEGSEAAAAN